MTTFSIENKEQIAEVLKLAGVKRLASGDIQTDCEDRPALLLFKPLESSFSVEVKEIDGHTIECVVAKIKAVAALATV